MEFLIGVAMVALVVGLVWLRIAGTRALNRHVFSRGQHAQGQDQTGRDMVITSSAAPQALREAIDRTVRAVTEVPRGVSADLYRASVTDDSTVYAQRTRTSTIFTMLVRATPRPRDPASSSRSSSGTTPTG